MLQREGRTSWLKVSTRSSKSSEPVPHRGKAAAAAVERAAHTLRDLRIAEVLQQDMVITDGKVEAYRVRLKVSFKYED